MADPPRPTAAETWFDLVVHRSAELRRAGVLSIGCDGNSAVLAPAEREAAEEKDEQGVEAREPNNPWESPTSYPTGSVPSIEVDEELPEIPSFGDG